MTRFPQLNKHATTLARHDNRDISKAGIPDQIIGHSNVIGSVASNAGAAAQEVSTITTSAMHDADENMQGELQLLTSKLFQDYSVGLWGYCMKQGSKIRCSHSSTTFIFDFSVIFGPLMTDIRRIIPNIDWKQPSVYHRLVRTIVWVYITAFVANALTVLLSCRKVYSLKGRRLLAVMSLVRVSLVRV